MVESHLFVGSYRSADEPGIGAFTFDESTARLRRLGSVAGVWNPSFLALHPTGKSLYAVGETGLAGDGRHGTVHAFGIDRSPGAVDLEPLGHHSTGGDYPCHLGLDAEGRWLAASNYGTGDVAVFPIAADGSLEPMASSVRHSGSGPNPSRQEAAHAHSATFTPDGRFLIVADLGIDRVVIYAFDGDTGTLSRQGEVEARPGAGPRHSVFHPDGKHLFVANELDSTVTLYRFSSGRLEELQTLSTLPPNPPENIAADIHLSPSGGHAYVSNRGDNSLAMFEFDPATGLELTAIRSCGGDWPRNFAVAPGGGHLLVANRRSDEVVVLALRDDGSDIEGPVARVAVPQPSCIVFG